MLAESIISEFFEREKLVPNAYVTIISDIIKVKRNKVREFIDLDAKQHADYLKLAYSRERTVKKKQKTIRLKKVLEEIAWRIKANCSKDEARKRKNIQGKLK